MPPYRPEGSSKGAIRRSDIRTWYKIRIFFDKQIAALEDIRGDEGLQQSKIVHKKMMEGMEGVENTDAWKRMFLEGQMRNPHAARMIKKTRSSFHRFMLPMANPEEEGVR